jgi:acyl-CoA synthetase (AMP-forming)/AMP-acid ligase II
MCVHKIKDSDLTGVDLSSWQVALNGAESISAETLVAFSDRFSKWGFNPKALTPVYGLSEAALAVTFSSLKEKWKQRAHPTENRSIMSLGPPLPGFQLEIRSQDEGVLPHGQVGRVWIQGPSLMREYLQNPEATETVLQDGWLDTGDLGFVEEGELHVVGRAKEVLILRGRNTPPEAVESAVAEIAGVRRGCVAAVCHRPPGGHTDELVLLVEQAKEFDLDPAQLAKNCREAVVASTGLLCWKVEILEPGTLPRTSSGKIRRIEAGQRFAGGTLKAAPEPGPLGLATAIVRSGWAMPKRGG